MKKKPAIDPEDSALFRDAIDGTRPLPGQKRYQPAPRTPLPRPLQRERDDQDVMAHLLSPPGEFAQIETGEEMEYRQNGVQLMVMRKLKRGQYSRQAELDLHGLTAAQARAQLDAFIKQSHEKGLQCVRVIHGKGLRSSQRGPVLKPKVANCLRQRQDVLAFCSARPVDGGTGATYVLLKRR